MNTDLFSSVFIRGLFMLLLMAPAGYAATLPAGFTETQISGLSNPTAMEIAPDGRIFVCEQGGNLRVIKNGALLSTPFLTVSVDSNGERGLLGIAFDPNFASNKFLYIYYTVSSTPRHNRVSRFTANGDVAVPGSETIILELDNLTTATNHNGGAIHFGPDGKLYVGVGENATGSNAQSLSNMLGKVLRINSDGTIPTDNPFFNTAAGNNRSIWALGLRNPFTFTFQPGTGRMFINDVGQDTWEEINDGIAGSNYGWNIVEGPSSNPLFRAPLFFYGHGVSATTGCAIAGGAFYNPATVQFPQSFVGKYFFADLCSGWIRVFDPATGTAAGFATGISQPVDLKVGADGSLYYLARGAGSVFRVQSTDPLLITEANSDVAIAFNSPTMMRDPFSLTNPFSLSADQRTRLMFFATNFDLLPGENSSAVTVRAEDAGMNVFPLMVEFVGKVPGFDWLTQIVVKLPDKTPAAQTLFLSATLHGKTTNKIRGNLR
jgi:glucose/arabinose dehydrogenase